MAPTIRAVTSAGTDGNTDPAPAKPAGLAVGDLMLAWHMGDADVAMASMTAPSGFTTIATSNPSVSGNLPACKIWRKVAVAGDVSASSFTFLHDSNGHSSVILMAITTGTYSSATPTTVGTVGTGSNPSNATMTAPSVTGVVDALLLAGYLAETGGAVRTFPSGTPPTGMTFETQSAQGTSTYTRAGVYRQVLASTAATGAKAVNLSATPDGWAALLILVNPGSAAPVVDAGADVASWYANNEFTRTAGETGTGITSRAWTIQAGPTGVGSTIGTAAALAWTPTVVGPPAYTLQYAATNPSGTGTDQMSITVVAQDAPTVNAGADVASHAVDTVFNRTATESANGSTITSRAWTIQSGPTGVGSTIGTAAALSWTPTMTGTYVLQYAATNGIGTGTDQMSITVTSGPPPTVNAGPDVTDHPVDTAFTRTATESGSGITAREWKIQSGPTGAGTVLATEAAMTGWFPGVAGTYVLRYSATNAGGTSFDDMSLEVVLVPATPGEILNIGVGAGLNHFSVDIARSPTVRELMECEQIEAGLDEPPFFTGTSDYSKCAFWTQVNAATTSGSSYPRCELREVEPGGSVNMAWDPHDGGTHWIRGSSAATHLMAVKPTLIMAQQHSGSDDVIQVRTRLVSSQVQLEVVLNGDSANAIVLARPYTVDTEYDWMLEILPPLNGQPAQGRIYYQSWMEPIHTWPVSSMPVTTPGHYYKAGNYLNSNTSTENNNSSEYGSSTLRNLQHWHTGWAAPDNGFWGLPEVDAGADISSPSGWLVSRTGVDTATDAARRWRVIDGPVGGTNVGQDVSGTADLNWSPTVQGTYRLRYGVITDIGTNYDDILVTVTAPVASTSGFLPFFGA